MQCAGEEQEAQHTVHQRVVEIDGADESHDGHAQSERGCHGVERDEDQRAAQRTSSVPLVAGRFNQRWFS